MSGLVYRLLLRLYPPGIRIRWEEDMVEAFELQLNDGWLDAWCSAIAEIFQIALPSRLARDVVVISFISATASGALLFCLIWALGNSIRLLSISHHLFARLGG